ncbi:hypothetical protein EIP91_001621, partial [Steccherinum ochraceum]
MPAPKKKSNAAGKAPMKRPPVTTAPLPTAAPATPPAANGKKKKKGKGKVVAYAEFTEDEGDEDMPPLEPLNGTAQQHRRSASRTGLSPELESVHLSTTASLSASTRFNPTAIAEAELLATADHLARSMDAVDPEGGGGGGANSEYWASFPEHLRNFVRHTYSQLSSPGNEDEKTQAMYAIAQQIHAGVGLNLNANSKGQTTTRYSSTTTYPFDPSIFTDPAFQQAMEQAAAANGLQPFRASDARFTEAATAATMLLANDYGMDDQDYGEDDYFSEEDGEEEGDELDGRTRTASFTLETHIQRTGST